ncbi:MAG: shikimate kinase [Spirochaetes bacterium]|nr:shikimate kinase [Spirochaetota bacterium]
MNRRSQTPHARIATPQKPRIAITGFRGVGKTQIARRLAEHWRMPLVALDEKIEHDASLRIEEIVALHGWQHFRDLEFRELSAAAQSERLLLDCGGGIVEEADGLPSERKMKILANNFFCIYLSISEERLLYRLRTLARNASRPDLSNADSPEALLEIFRRREILYLKIAHAVIDISDTNIAESALRITQMFR